MAESKTLVDFVRRDSPISPLVDGLNLSNSERLRRGIGQSHNWRRRLQHYNSQNVSQVWEEGNPLWFPRLEPQLTTSSGSIDNASQISALFLGRAAAFGAGFRVTPLVQNRAIQTFYYLALS